MTLRMIFSLAVLITLATSSANAVLVDGNCYLENQVYHHGTKVLFTPNPSGELDSTYTDTSGSYSIDLVAGTYAVYFTHEGFDEFANEYIIDLPTTLPDVTLTQQGTPISGQISGTLTAGTYLVTNAIEVLNGDSLFIEPGVVLIFSENAGLHINGSYLHAVGTETDSIRFIGNPGISWSGIIFQGSLSDSSILKYCLIEGEGSGAGINIESSSPTIANSTISGHGDGIYADAQYGSSAPTIDHCLISGNEFGFFLLNSSPTISNCTISGNETIGIGCFGSLDPTVLNTIVEGSEYGLWLSTSGIEPSISYCNFYNNTTNFYNGTPNLGQIITFNANGDPCDAYYNIFEDPMFVDPANGDFHLQAGSACINAGDPLSPFDPDATIADIGALYFIQPLAADIEVSTTVLDFGELMVGESTDLDFIIYNVGDADLVIHDITVSDPAFVTNYDPADSLIVPGDSLVVTTTFTPAEIHNYSEILTIDNNDEPVEIALNGAGIGPVAAILEPYGAPIVIPESGGSFDFYVGLENLTSTAQTVDIWTAIHLPEYGEVPVLSVTDISLQGSVLVTRDRSQTVPEYAPAGTYTYYCYVGTYPWVVDDVASFTFEKEGTDEGGTLGSPVDWICSGEGFDDLLSPGKELDFPTEYELAGAYPNPFNPVTTLRYGLPEDGNVRFTVFNVKGEQVAILADGYRAAGYHEVAFDAAHLASGMYIYRLTAGDFTGVGKMVLMK